MAKSLKPAVFVFSLLPLFWLPIAYFTGRLSANPIDDITDTTGTWTLRFLMITLAVTPVRKMSGWNQAITYRRMLGLFAFFYGCLHLLTYLWLDQFFAWGEIIKDIGKRPFITAGMTALFLMLPLAVTSTKKWIARLGGKRWQALHRLVYVSAAAGVVHYFWLVKVDKLRPLVYAGILGVLLLTRATFTLYKRDG